MLSLLDKLGKAPDSILDVVDIGAATGLSSLALLEALPGARQIDALDLSPHFLAVGRYLQQQRHRTGGCADNGRVAEPITFRHAAGEATGLPDSSVDLVSICLVCHELPQSATAAVVSAPSHCLPLF